MNSPFATTDLVAGYRSYASPDELELQAITGAPGTGAICASAVAAASEAGISGAVAGASATVGAYSLGVSALVSAATGAILTVFGN